jgi:hypothetical protein
MAGEAVIVAADTTVDVDGQILEKPTDDDDARRMLRLLSGRTHLVHTGVTVTWFPEAPGAGNRDGGGGDRGGVRGDDRGDDRLVRGHRRALRQGRRLCDPGCRRARWCDDSRGASPT